MAKYLPFKCSDFLEKVVYATKFFFERTNLSLRSYDVPPTKNPLVLLSTRSRPLFFNELAQKVLQCSMD
jgi:hypothetical protein